MPGGGAILRFSLLAAAIVLGGRAARAQMPDICPPPAQWVSGGGGMMCQCPDGSDLSLGQQCGSYQAAPPMQQMSRIPHDSTAHVGHFGAIAYSPSDGALGWSNDTANMSAADASALQGCRQHSYGCSIVVRFNAACGAVAVGENGGWGADTGQDTEAAQHNAIVACNNHGNSNCQAIRWVCSRAWDGDEKVDCGNHTCSAGNKCSSSGGCIPTDSVDCGPRLRQHCPEGTRCWVAPDNIPGQIVKGRLYCPRPSEAADYEQKIRDIVAEKRHEEERLREEASRKAEEARVAREEAARRAKEERETKAKLEREQREAAAKAKLDEAKRQKELKEAAERARQDAVKVEAQRRKDEAERQLAERRRLEEDVRQAAAKRKADELAKAQAERERQLAQKAAHDQIAKEDKELDALARNPKETPAARSIAAIALGKDPASLGIPQTVRGPAPPPKPNTAERELALIALGKTAPSSTKPGEAAQGTSAAARLKQVLDDPNESSTAKKIAEIALRQQQNVSQSSPASGSTPAAINASPINDATSRVQLSPLPNGKVQVRESGKPTIEVTAQVAASQYGYRPHMTTIEPLAPQAGLRPGATQSTPIGTGTNANRTQYTALPNGRIQVSEVGRPPIEVSPQVAASQYGYQPNLKTARANPVLTSSGATPVQNAGLPFAVVGKTLSDNVSGVSTAAGLASDAKMISAISGKVLVGSGAQDAGRLLQSPQWSASVQIPALKSVAPVLSTVSNGVDLYKAYKSGDKIGVAIGTLSTANAGADVAGHSVAGVGTVTSLGRDAQALGTALGIGDKWTVDKTIQVGAAGSLMVGKSAAAGAAYLTFGALGGPAAGLKAADVTTNTIDAGMATQAWAFGKFTDTQIFKNATNSWLHIRDNEEASAQANALYEQLRAKRLQQQ
jgi:hypothetical protein